jgi:hypothetical protein
VHNVALVVLLVSGGISYLKFVAALISGSIVGTEMVTEVKMAPERTSAVTANISGTDSWAQSRNPFKELKVNITSRAA